MEKHPVRHCSPTATVNDVVKLPCISMMVTARLTQIVLVFMLTVGGTATVTAFVVGTKLNLIPNQIATTE